MNRDVAIVGMECVLPGAGSLVQYWDNLVDGVDAITEVPAGRLNGRDRLSPHRAAPIPCNRGGFLPESFRFDPLKFGVMPAIVPHGDPDQFLMLHVIDGALADASIAPDDPLRHRTDVIIGRGGYLTNKFAEIYYRSDLLGHMLEYLDRRLPELGRERIDDIARELQASFGGHDVDSISTCIPNLAASRAANRLDLRGAAYTVDAACASSLVAVEQAVQRLRQGLCDAAVVCGVFLCQTPLFWWVFTQLGAMSPSEQIRPLDRRADGLLVGEGAGAVVLRRLDDARRDHNQVYAVIKGTGTASDGRDTHVLSSSSRGQIEALRRAYADARVDPATIGYLEAHGTATVAGDRAELQTIRDFYGERGRFPPSRAMGSVKSMIGHTMPAAGIASLIKTALCLSNKTLVPSLHCEEPHEDLKCLPFYVCRETVPWLHDPEGPPRRGAVNAFGFGGINAHVILEEVTEPVAGSVPSIRSRPISAGRSRDSELILLSAAGEEELARRITRVTQFLDAWQASADDRPSLADLAHTLRAEIDFTHPLKLALVARNVEQLRGMLANLIGPEGFRPPDPKDEGVYYSPHADRPMGKVAGIFPGVGFPGLIGNYPSHLMGLCRMFPEVRAEFDRAQARDRHGEDTVPTSLVFAPPASLPEPVQLDLRNRIAAQKVIVDEKESKPAQPEPWQRNFASAAVTLSNWVSWLVLRRLGVPVDMVCGQSQGEIAALCASEMLSFDDVISRCWRALDVSPGYEGKGRLAFICTSESRLAPYLADAPDTSVAIHVAPEMLIVGGPDDQIVPLTQRLRDEGIIAKELPYPPIHTPRLSHLREELARLIDLNVRFDPPRVAMYSAVIADRFPTDQEEIRELALSNLDRPVRFWQTIHRMYEDGARVFIQVGGGTLASNIMTILPRPDIVGTAVDVDHFHPLTQLHHLAATLFAAGVRFEPQRMDQDRALRRLDLDASPQSSNPRRVLLPLRMDWIPVPPERMAESEHHAEPEPPVLPMLDEILEHEPGRRLVAQRVLDLDRDLFLHDHILIDERSRKPLANRSPILPMTFILETAAETAVALAPGLGLIGLERITAARWIDLRDTRTLVLTVRAELESLDPETGVHRVAVELAADGNPSATATVLLGQQYREDIRLDLPELTNLRPWPMTAEEVYSQRHMFHGPRFRCVTSLDELGDEGMTGQLTVLPAVDLFAGQPRPQLLTDPVVMDGVAQLLAMFAIARGTFIMPAKIAKVEFYRPTPPPGARLPVRIAVHNLDTDSRTILADAEIQDGSGYVWFRIEGITEWVYDYVPRLQDTYRMPNQYHLAESWPLPGSDSAVGVVLRRSDLRHATIEWIGRLFLHVEEWEHLQQIPLLRQQWQWLMGRIAAKDAVRICLARQMGGEMPHPARILIRPDARGKPVVQAAGDLPPMPQISIAHCDGWAAAAASHVPCGIDIEPEGRDLSEILPHMTTDSERDLLARAEQAAPEDCWPLRLWCAKEALGKALGTGLDGRPMDFEAKELAVDGRIAMLHRPSGGCCTIHTRRDAGLITAFVALEGN